MTPYNHWDPLQRAIWDFEDIIQTKRAELDAVNERLAAAQHERNVLMCDLSMIGMQITCLHGTLRTLQYPVKLRDRMICRECAGSGYIGGPGSRGCPVCNETGRSDTQYVDQPYFHLREGAKS